MAGFLVACGGAPEPQAQGEAAQAVDRAVVPEIQMLEPAYPFAILSEVRLDLLKAEVFDAADGSGSVLRVTVAMRSRAVQDTTGLERLPPAVQIGPENLSLRVDGVLRAERPQSVTPAPASMQGEAWQVPSGGEDVWTRRLTWPLAQFTPETKLSLVLQASGGQAEIVLQGPALDAQGQPGVALLALGPDGRAFGLEAPLHTDRRGTSRDQLGEAWIVAPGSGPWEIETPEWSLDPLMAPSTGTRLVYPQPVPLLARGRAELGASLSGADPAPYAPRFESRVGAYAAPEAIAAWISAHIALTPAQSMRSSLDGVLRSGRGSAFERTMLAVMWLEAWGRRARVACGDLEPADVTRLFPVVEPPEPGDPEVAALAQGFEALPDVPLSARGKAPLVPEWCWPEVEVQPDAPWEPLSLTPEGADSITLPMSWRVTNNARTDGWMMRIDVGATLQGKDGYRDVLITSREASPSQLERNALAVEFIPEGRDAWRAYDYRVMTEAVSGREDTQLDLKELVSVWVRVSTTDPLGIAGGTRTIWLWDRTEDRTPGGLLAVIAGDPIDPQASLLAERRDALREARHPHPAIAALVAELNRIAIEREQLAGGGVPHEPQLLFSIVERERTGRTWRRIESLAPVVGAVPTGQASNALQARWAAADALARARALGVAPPEAPAHLLTDVASLQSVEPLYPRAQSELVRRLDRETLARSDRGDVWRFDRGIGGWMWTIPGGVEVENTAPPQPHEAYETVHAELWDVPVRCMVAATWPGVTPPKLCRPDAP